MYGPVYLFINLILLELLRGSTRVCGNFLTVGNRTMPPLVYGQLKVTSKGAKNQIFESPGMDGTMLGHGTP
jgi:hypothetical protein